VNTIALALRQARSENRSFWRNPASALFTFAFPLMFLVIFTTAFGNEDIDVIGGTATASTFYIPAIAAFSVITACYTNIAMTVTFARDQGILKRIRGTPLPELAFLTGKILNSIFVAVLLVVIVVVFGHVFYDVQLPGHTLPAFIVTLSVGAAVFCALGLAITGFVSNAEAAPAVINFSILPLLFISDIFLRSDNWPDWINTLSGIFPVKHFSEALQVAFNPFEKGSGFEPKDLAVMAVWGVLGLVVALRRFTWEPRR
jgi:ABC-2 type transport system permease protein